MDYPALLAHPQVSALGAITEIDYSSGGKFKTVRPVARFSETEESIRLPPPKLGQHTRAVLHAAGMVDPDALPESD
jgi:succinate--hydroxymethylglutarate CoA-transferase